MKKLIFAALGAALVCACSQSHGSSSDAVSSDSDSLRPMLQLSVLETMDGSNDALVDSAVDVGNPHDLAVAFLYYFNISGSDQSKTARAIEIYDDLKKSKPDEYGSILYDVSQELERRNYGRMVDSQVDYLRSISSYGSSADKSDDAGESVSR